MPRMVLPDIVLQPAGNTMKNTIDDVDYMINPEYFLLYNQYVINPSHSHSIVAGGLLEIS